MKKAPRNYSQDMDRRRQGLDAIVENLLPDVTTDDAGKIAKVGENGKWTLADDGGVQTMTVAITYDSEQEKYSADKIHAEILAAITSGSTVRATYDGRTYVYAGTGKDSAGTPIYFSYTQSDSESQMIEKVFEIDEDERMVFSEHNIAEELPAVTSADEGAILAVDETGIWNKKRPNTNLIYIPFYEAGKLKYAIPRVTLTANSRLTPDNDGYYESDINVQAIYESDHGYPTSITSELLETININILTDLFISLNVNDGNEDLNLRGYTPFSNNKVFSSNFAAMIKIAAHETILNSINHSSEIFKMYDITTTWTNSVFHIKFKLEKITTT